MRLRGTPVFPKNMVLGCIRNDSLLYEYGREMARQCRELGVQVNFAPVADVNINPKNPVINTRSFGESPVNVADKVTAYAKGLEDGGVLSVSKHFPVMGIRMWIRTRRFLRYLSHARVWIVWSCIL